MEEEQDVTPCANCLEICENGRVVDRTMDLIYCSMSCRTEHRRHKAILGQGEGRTDGDDSDNEAEFVMVVVQSGPKTTRKQPRPGLQVVVGRLLGAQ